MSKDAPWLWQKYETACRITNPLTRLERPERPEARTCRAPFITKVMTLVILTVIHLSVMMSSVSTLLILARRLWFLIAKTKGYDIFMGERCRFFLNSMTTSVAVWASCSHYVVMHCSCHEHRTFRELSFQGDEQCPGVSLRWPGHSERWYSMVLEDLTVSSPSYRSDSKLMQPDATWQMYYKCIQMSLMPMVHKTCEQFGMK